MPDSENRVFLYPNIIIKMEKSRIVFFGTPEIAASQLEAVLNAGFDVAAVVTGPDKPSGRGKKIHFSEVKETALKHNLKLLQPEKLKDPDFIAQLESLDANLFVVIAFRMLPAVVWKIPRLGTFNLHASLLPQYRGAAPINHAIINGETETGLTTFFIDEEIDKGKIILQKKMEIGHDENAGSLHDRMMILGNKLVVETIRMIENGTAQSINQAEIIKNENLVLNDAPKIFREDCYIKWNLPIGMIFNQIRGLSPYPAAYTTIVSEENEAIDLKIFASEIEVGKTKEKLFTLLTDKRNYLKVALPDGYLFLTHVQLSGKKAMPIKDFLMGQRLDGEWKVIEKSKD